MSNCNKSIADVDKNAASINNETVAVPTISASVDYKIVSLWPGFDKYFQLMNQDVVHFFVKCLLCRDSSKQLIAPKRSAHNIKQHIKTVHKNLYDAFLTEIEEAKQLKSKKRSNSDYSTVVKSKQPKLKEFLDIQKPMTKDRFEGLVVDAVLDAHLSTRVVENSSVKKLLNAGFPGFEIHRTTLTDRINKRHSSMIDSTTTMFEAIKYVCLTADCWTSFRRSFLGVTAHWIDINDFSRESCTLACRRIKGSHRAEVLATKLDDVISSFKLSEKVVKIVTDNGSNFVKAFKLTQSFLDENNEEVTDDDAIEFFEVTGMLNHAIGSGFILPPHKRCAAHSANLTMSSDMKKQIKNEEFKKMEELALDKCSALFKKQGRSSLVADLIKERLGRYLVTPSKTRWNYVVDAIRVLLDMIDEKPLQVNSIFEDLKLTKLTQSEIAFLKEYVMVLGIVADALDILQGENFMYMGLYSPTIIRLLQRLAELKNLKYCECLVKELRISINERFSDIHEYDNLKAAMLHPFFKNFAFLTGKQANSRLRNDLIDQLSDELLESDEYKKYVSEFTVKSNATETSDSISKIKILNDFFFKDKESPVAKSSSSKSMLTPKQIINSYLISDDLTINSLKSFPLIQNLFIKYNTAIPSSAPCERLFSTAKHILTPFRCSITDSNFENRLMLKTNSFKK